jgi:hypothetical protein
MTGITVKNFRDIVIPEATVSLGKESFVVRGLDMLTLLTCFEGHLEVLDDLLEGRSNAAAGKLVNDFPKLVGTVIATATGAPDLAEKAMALPTGVQMDALVKIFELSFPDQDLVGKFWARLEEVVEKVTKAYMARKEIQSGTAT